MFWERTCQHLQLYINKWKIEGLKASFFLCPIKPENYTSKEKGKQQ